MGEVKFDDVESLYKRIKPLLKLKQKLFKKLGYEVGINNIWLFLVETKWKVSHNLTLYDIVNDIMILDYRELKDFYGG
ncbi:MAG: hypothetical protein IJI43_02945 [Bacilli bacterium]|nr:hypothetical protein [Bacilli bacterium]